jgi:hypothetical protein
MLMKRGCTPVFAVAGEGAAPSPRAGVALATAQRWAPTAKVAIASDPTDATFLAALAQQHKAAAFTIGTLARDGALDGPNELADGYPTFHPLLTMTDEEIAAIPFDM